ncbi:MAG: PQQ-binding-like beta-propeller repeat protein [Lentimicrobiaceae bacterium]
MKKILIPIIVLLLSARPVAAQAISEWRPDNRTGVSSETGLLKSWPENGPKLLWTNLELPKGNSSVSFNSNSLFLTGLSGQNDILVSLDTLGKIKWQTSIGRAWTDSYPESRSTPTVEGNRIYTSSGFGDLACVDATSGEIIWSYKASEIHKGTYGSWGIAESILIDGDKLYFSPGGPETMTIALNKANGSLIWKSASLNDKPGYVSPILIEYAGKKMIVNVSLGHAFAVDASNGEILWKVAHAKARPGQDLIFCVTPLFHDGMVYVTGGYDIGGMMVKIAEDGKSAKVAWTDNVLDVHHGGVVLVNGYIYGSNWLNNSNGNWCCIDWNTGKKMWEEHWNCKGSIISAEGMLYIYEEKKGNVGLLNANPEKFDLVSSFQVTQGVSGPFWAHPVIHNGVLYVRHNNALMAYDIKAK